MDIAYIQDVAERTLRDPQTGKERRYYTGVFQSDKAKALTFVPVLECSKKTFLEENTDGGYQRPGSAVRMRSFAKFVSDNPLSVVPPIVLSGRNLWVFERDHRRLRVTAPAAIIDGQHRVGGYVCLFEEDQVCRSIEFMLIPDLERDEEVDEFLTINSTQKGVPQSLNVLLQASDEALIAEQLNDNKSSPFYGRITKVQKRPGDLFSLAAVAKNVGRTFRHGAFETASTDDRFEIMVRYWEIIADQHPEEWGDFERAPKDQQFKLLETTGLIAWSLAAEDILGPWFNPELRAMNWDAVEKQINKLASPGALDWRKDGEFQGLTGEVGGARIHKKMQQVLAMKGTPFDEATSEDAWPT
jgi:DNA sulfur modification protein DndB